jgi:hypothetical protein
VRMCFNLNRGEKEKMNAHLSGCKMTYWVLISVVSDLLLCILSCSLFYKHISYERSREMR